jgi:hypothetical protein
MKNQIPLREAARRLHERNRSKQPKNNRLRDFDDKTQIYGVLLIDENYQGGERMVGFVIAGSFDDQLKYTIGALPSRRGWKVQMAGLCDSIIAAGGLQSSHPLAFVFTTAQHDQGKNTSWTIPFTAFTVGLKYIYDLTMRRCLIDSTVPGTFFFAQ